MVDFSSALSAYKAAANRVVEKSTDTDMNATAGSRFGNVLKSKVSVHSLTVDSPIAHIILMKLQKYRIHLCLQFFFSSVGLIREKGK